MNWLACLLVVGTAGRLASAASDPRETSPVNWCEAALVRPSPEDPADVADADEFIAWLSFRHPILRDVLLRTDDVTLAFDLFNLSAGFSLPPGLRWIKPGAWNRPYEHWLRAMVPRKLKTFAALGSRNRSVEVADLLSVPREPRQRNGSMARMAALLLQAITNPKHHRPGEANLFDVEFTKLFTAHRLTVELPRIELSLKSVFTEYELNQLTHLSRALQRDAVRVLVMDKLDSLFDRIAAERAHFVRSLVFCNDIRKFRRAYQDLSGTAASFGAVATRPKITRGAFAPDPGPGEISQFLSECPPWPSFTELSRDLARASDLLAAQISRLDALRPREAAWTQWARDFDATPAQLNRLRFELGRQTSELGKAQPAYETAAAELQPLFEWILQTRERVASPDGLTLAMDDWSATDRLNVAPVLRRLALLESLARRTSLSVDLRRQAMVAEMTAASDLLLLVVDLASHRLESAEAATDPSLRTKFLEIKSLLDQLAAHSAAK